MSAPATARSTGVSRGRDRLSLLSVGMVLFLGSELMFFAALFAAYFTLRAEAPAWPPPGTHLDLREAAIFTVLLVASSGTMQIAVRRIERGDDAGMKRWIWVSLGLGAIFLAGQLYGYLRANFHIGSNTYGSAYYAMTGFHGLHVLGGLLAMLVILGRAAAGAYSAARHEGVVVATYYWHFVDVIWIGVFSSVYLIR